MLRHFVRARKQLVCSDRERLSQRHPVVLFQRERHQLGNVKRDRQDLYQLHSP